MKEKKFNMIWEVAKAGRTSHIAGTAHFFPYSFRTSLSGYIKAAGTILLEGPLDDESTTKVVAAGSADAKAYHLFDDLDEKTIAGLKRVLSPGGRKKALLNLYSLLMRDYDQSLYAAVRGMKPWRAFFTLWRKFLEQNGWRYSVDLEAYQIAKEMNKEIVFLESIEEQIQVLENLSLKRIIRILKQVDQWPDYAQEYVGCYLEGDLDRLKSMRSRFPTRHPEVIDDRDAIFYKRMYPYLEQGEALVFVGAPHVRGISKMLAAAGYQIRRP